MPPIRYHFTPGGKETEVQRGKGGITMKGREAASNSLHRGKKKQETFWEKGGRAFTFSQGEKKNGFYSLIRGKNEKPILRGGERERGERGANFLLPGKRRGEEEKGGDRGSFGKKLRSCSSWGGEKKRGGGEGFPTHTLEEKAKRVPSG